MQLSPEDQERVFGKDKLKTAYQREKRSLNLNRRVKRDYITSMSEVKDDLKNIKVYKFTNTKEDWHEFALTFRVIADTRDYWGIMAFPYPPDPGEHIVERSATPTTLVERDKLDLSSLVPPKGEIETSFSWTCPFKCPTSSTLCFGEPTLGKLNQETEFYMTKHMPKSFSETNRVSDCHSSLVTTPSSRLILDEPNIEVAKALIHHIGKNGELFYGENFIYDFPQSWKHIKEVDWGDKLKLNYTISGYMLKEVDWGDKSNFTSCGCPMANWHESLLSEVDWGAHHSSDVLFLVNIDYDAKSQDFFTQGIWGGLAVRTSSTTLRSLNHVKEKLAHYLNLQKDPSRLDHQLDQQKDSKSSPCPQYESSYNLLNQWDPGENPLLPQHFRTIISAKVIYFLWIQSKYNLSCIL